MMRERCSTEVAAQAGKGFLGDRDGGFDLGFRRQRHFADLDALARIEHVAKTATAAGDVFAVDVVMQAG